MAGANGESTSSHGSRRSPRGSATSPASRSAALQASCSRSGATCAPAPRGRGSPAQRHRLDRRGGGGRVSGAPGHGNEAARGSALIWREAAGSVDRRLGGSAGAPRSRRAGRRARHRRSDRHGAQQRPDQDRRGTARCMARSWRRSRGRPRTAGRAGCSRHRIARARHAERRVGSWLRHQALRESRPARRSRCPASGPQGLSGAQANDRGLALLTAGGGPHASVGGRARRAGADGARRSRLCSSRPRQDPAAQDRAGAMRGGTRGRPGGTRAALTDAITSHSTASQPHGCGESRPLLKGSFIDKEKESREKNGHHR